MPLTEASQWENIAIAGPLTLLELLENWSIQLSFRFLGIVCHPDAESTYDVENEKCALIYILSAGHLNIVGGIQNLI